MAGSPHEKQTRLALSREARLELLEQVDYVRAGLSSHQWERVRRLCEALEEATDRTGRASVATLATKCRCSERTLFRTQGCGRRAGVITTAPTYDDQGRSANEWRVAWDRLAILAGWTSSGDCPVPAKKMAGTGRHRGEVAGTDVVFISSPTEKKLLKPSSPQPVQGSNLEAIAVPLGTEEEVFYFRSGAKPSDDRGGATRGVLAAGKPSEVSFFALEKKLAEAGVDRAAKAVRVAAEQGFTADQVAAIVEHWRFHGGGTNYAAWGPAALCWRLTNVSATIPVERGWPSASPAFTRYQEKCRERERREREARAREANQVAAIEARRGPSIEAQFREAIRNRPNHQPK